MRRPLGAALILAGCFVIAIDIPWLDDVVASLSPRQGLHLSDILGAALAVAGIAVLWRS